jgi:hypothetical protein
VPVPISRDPKYPTSDIQLISALHLLATSVALALSNLPSFISISTIIMSSDLNLKASIYFLARSPKYSTIKPYTLRYRPENGFAQTNVERILHEIEIRDLRKSPELKYEECGFKMVRLNGSGGMRYEDYDDLEVVEGRHQREVVDAVREGLGAREVFVCDYVVFNYFTTSPLLLSLVLFDFGFGGNEADAISRSEDEIQTGQLVKGAVISGSSRRVRLILIIRMMLELRS